MGSGRWGWKWQLAKIGPHRVTGGGWRAGVVQGTGLYDGRLRVPNSGAVLQWEASGSDRLSLNALYAPKPMGEHRRQWEVGCVVRRCRRCSIGQQARSGL